MGESEVTKSSLRVNKKEKDGSPRVLNPAISSFFLQLPHKFQNALKSQLSKLAKNDGINSVSFVQRNRSGSFSASEAELDEQLRAWKENPSWVDNPSKIKVTVPKGSLCNLNVEVNVGLPPDAVYNIVIDPDNRRVFKNIKCFITLLGGAFITFGNCSGRNTLLSSTRDSTIQFDNVFLGQEVISRKVLVDEGHRQVVELDQAALWRFLWWSGTISVHVLVDQNREDHSMKFKQVKTGFMKKFEGCWKVDPLFVDEKTCYPFKPKTKEEYNACTRGKGRIGSRVSLQQILEPAIVPPPPISWYLRGITTRTTEMLINDLLAETARIRGGFEDGMSKGELQGASDENQDLVGETSDIKERWLLRRKNAKQNRRRLHPER